MSAASRSSRQSTGGGAARAGIPLHHALRPIDVSTSSLRLHWRFQQQQRRFQQRRFQQKRFQHLPSSLPSCRRSGGWSSRQCFTRGCVSQGKEGLIGRPEHRPKQRLEMQATANECYSQRMPHAAMRLRSALLIAGRARHLPDAVMRMLLPQARVWSPCDRALPARLQPWRSRGVQPGTADVHPADLMCSPAQLDSVCLVPALPDRAGAGL